MRLAIVTASLPRSVPGGAEYYAESIARELAGRHSVSVLTGTPEGSGELVTEVPLPAPPPLRASGSALHKSRWHLGDQWRPSVYLAAREALRGISPDLVFTHNVQGLSASVFTAIERLDLPHVHMAHDFNLICVRTNLTRGGRFCGARCRSCRVQRVVRGGIVSRHVDRLIAPSEFLRQVHMRAGIVPAERAVTIPHGVLPGRDRIRRPTPGTATLGFIGALAPHKGVDTLVDAFRSAPAGWRLLIAGSGPSGARLEAEAARDPRISMLGHVGGQEKEDFYARLDALVVPSECEEVASLVAAEANIRGIPLIASDRGGLPEWPEVRVFPSGDARALLRVAHDLLRSPEEVAAVSRELLERRREFEWSTHVGRIERVLSEVAGVEPPAQALGHPAPLPQA